MRKAPIAVVIFALAAVLAGCSSGPSQSKGEAAAAPSTPAADLPSCTEFNSMTVEDELAVLSTATGQSLDENSGHDLMKGTQDACSMDSGRPLGEVIAELTGSPATADGDSDQSSDGDAGGASTANQHIWEVCYAPSGSADQVNSNPAVINEVLADYPDFWKSAAPTPTDAVSGICHQHIPGEGGVNDVWWVHFKDAQAGYTAAVAWDRQLVGAGAVKNCASQYELSNGPDGSYNCSYVGKSGGGYTASISNSHGAVELLLQPAV